jgi:hypothetical protein
MNSISLFLDGDGAWPDMKSKIEEGKLINLTGGTIGLALLVNGTVGGNPSVSIRLDLPDGQVVFTQTTLALLSNAVRAMNIRTSQPPL